MGLVLKVLLAALLTLPAGAYVAGILTADRSSLQRQHTPVVLDDPVAAEPEETVTSRPQTPPGRPDPGAEDRGGVEVIGPATTELDDDGRRDGDRDDGRRDGDRDDDGGRDDDGNRDGGRGDGDRDDREEDTEDDREEDRSGSDKGPEDDDEHEAEDDRSGSGGDDGRDPDDELVDD
ncbi:MAG: hypothetical protein ACLGH4_02970 [Actinomycetes bacterium]